MDSIGSPLPEVSYVFQGDDGLRWTVLHCVIQEGLSELYEGTLVLAGEGDPTPDALLGGVASLLIHRGTRTRALLGVVRFVEDLGSTATHRHVRVGMVPQLWLLSQRVDLRIFQELTAVEIVTDVLRRAGVYLHEGGYEKGAFGRLPKREYCVQYRESDLDFVLRLLQEEGIPFYFRHHLPQGETLVLVDDPARYDSVPTLEGAGHLVVSDGAMNLMADESVRWFDVRRELRPTGVTLQEYDFTHPRARRDLTPSSPPGGTGGRAQYDYPARFALHRYDETHAAYAAHDGVPQARLRQEMNQVAAVKCSGRGNVSGLMPGLGFTLSGHQRADLDQAYLVTHVEHRGQAWSDIPADVRASEHLWHQLVDAGVQDPGASAVQRYTNRFEVIPLAVPFRPARTVARPIVQGAQTARVVGPAGEEIHTDPHGRIKVQFHWDRVGAEDEHSSCWVRVSQNWAGSGWGFQFIPRIGMEVVVGFLEGDPDRPLVTGCVYNGEKGYPYPLPDGKTRSGIKTESTHRNGGFNEFRFEDQVGHEEVFLRAQRDLTTMTLNDATHSIVANRSTSVGGNNKHVTQGNHIVRVGSNESRNIEGNHETIVRGEHGASHLIDNFFLLDVGKRLALTCGASSIVLTPDGIRISGPIIRLRGDELLSQKSGLIKMNCVEDED